MQLQQRLVLRLRFHPFGNHVQTEVVGHANHGLHHRLVVAVGDDVLHKAAVNFELVQRQAFQVRQRGVAGAKVVQREAHALRAQRLHGVGGVGDIVQHQAFGQLQDQPVGVSAAAVQGALHLGDKLWVAKLPRADVDRQRQRVGQGVALPALELQAGLLQHPLAQRQDQARAFSNRNKHRRRDAAKLRVRPAQQHFSAQGLALAIDLQLVVQLKLPGIDRAVQGVLQPGARVQLRLHGRVEEAKAVAPAGFGVVHGHIGAFEQVFERGVVALKQADANAGAGALDVAGAQAGVLEGGEQLLGHAADVLAGAAFLRWQGAEQDDKLVTTEA